MNLLRLVRLTLIAGQKEPSPSQDKLRLEPAAQNQFDSYCQSFSIGRPFPPVLPVSLTAWFERGCGRKVYFEIEPPFTGVGEAKRIEVASKEELSDLIGDGKTLETLLRAFANVEPALAQ